MKRIRLSTLMMLVVIAALSLVVTLQQVRINRLMAELKAIRAQEVASRALAEAMLERARAMTRQIEALEGASR